MPTPEQILDGLTHIANQWQTLAIVWHIYFAILAGGLALGVRPTKRVGAILLALPLISVSVLAWLTANPFNGTLFAAAAIALLVIAVRMPQAKIDIAPLWLVGAGALLFVFGWVYPHFLQSTSFAPYVYAAPTRPDPVPDPFHGHQPQSDGGKLSITRLGLCAGRHGHLLRPLWQPTAGCDD